MQFSVRKAFALSIAVLMCGLVLQPQPVRAQFSDSYNFLKAVRDADGAKATEFINTPGSSIIDTRDRTTGQTALHIVIARRDASWTNFLLGKGAKPDIRDSEGNTPLMLAAQLGFAEGAQALITRKAQVNLANARGETPLIRAVQNRDLRMVRLLLTAGADANRADTLAGLSAYDYAKRDPRNVAVLREIEDSQKTAKPKGTMGP